ncbi:MAG: T9SS type A sorting domain-containing protein [Bacteroidia bacterium]|nr:T9SS type A sorting domain-containing protein [Bacteroidia bacterium]
MKTQFLFVAVMLVYCVAFAQNNTVTTTGVVAEPAYDLPVPLTSLDSFKLASIPRIPIPANYKNLPVLPYLVDNSLTPYLRPVFNQSALECGQASGIGMAFTYAMSWTRNLYADSIQNQYPTYFAWNFMNGGANTGVSFFDTWMVLKDFGIPNVPDWGGTLSYGGPTHWMTGYNYYYHAMHNRLQQVYTIPCRTPAELTVLKHWINDHLDGSTTGGVANYYASVPSLNTLAGGTPEAGKKVIISWGNANHGMTIVGYNDSIRWDYNGDGQYTNNLDINGDGVVDLKDWEIGAFKMCNTYGGGPAWGDQGFAYVMYRTMAMPYGSGGIWSNSAYVQYCRKNTEPLLTMKITLKHTSRNMIKVTAGVSADTTATAPSFIMEYPVFNYQGGNYYMQGGSTEADKTLEFGLDVTPLLDKIGSGIPARFFLMVRENDPSNTATGMIVSYSLMDYTGSPVVETAFPQTNVPITENGLKTLAINKTTVYNHVQITSDTLCPATVYEPYSCQLTASGGQTPYTWQFDTDFPEHDTTATFPAVTANDLSFSNLDNGTVTQTLPFTFPFYGVNYTQMKISVDGFIMFNSLPPSWPYLISSLDYFLSHESISPFYCNLYLATGLGDHIWYEGNSSYATVRWKVQVYNQSGSEVNFAVRLYPSGKIEYYYGTMNFPVSTYWIAGIFSGDGMNYQYTNNSGLPTVSSGSLLQFPRNVFPPELSVSSSGLMTGTPLQEYLFTPVAVKVTDGSKIVARKLVHFHTIGINSIVITGHTISSNLDTIMEPGETAVMSLNLENYGSVPFSNCRMMITNTDPDITLTDSTQLIGAVGANQVFTLNNAFTFNIANNIPDNYTFNFGTYIYTPADTFHSHIILNAHAPVVSTGSINVQDGNNMSLDPGETATVEVQLNNTGGGKALNINSTITTSDPYITINNGSDFLAILGANSTGQLGCNISVSSGTPMQHIANFNLHLLGSNGFTYNSTFSLPIGQVMEDFNLGYFSLPDWNFGGNGHWYATTDAPYEGSYCAKSGLITDNQQSWFSLTGTVQTPGNVSFYYKVSCENDPNGTNYDYFGFYVDGNELVRCDGEIPWSQASFPVGTGQHTFKWLYSKDYSVSAGSDCSWVDYILFPVISNFILESSLTETTGPGLQLSCIPNPCNTGTDITFSLDKPAQVILQILNLQGVVICNLSDRKEFGTGRNEIHWDANDNKGNRVPGGIYFIRLVSGQVTANEKVVVIR